MDGRTRIVVEVKPLCAWEEVSDNIARVADANLDVVERVQTGIFVERFAFDKKRAHRLERCFGFFLSKFVECFKDRPVEITSAQVAAFVLQGPAAGDFAEFQVRRVSGFHEVEMFGVNEVEAIAEVNDCTEDRGSFDFAGFLLCFVLRPAQGAGGAVFPKIKAAAKPVIFVGASELLLLARDNFAGNC